MAQTRPRTLDEFLLMPEEQPALEYERGEIIQKMSPMSWHGIVQWRLAMRFEMHGHPRLLIRAMTEARVIWPAERISYIPDVIAYRADRVPTDVHGDVENRLTVPPDVAVEIHSPGQVLGTQMDRCQWYVEHGVPVALLVHPERRTVWTFRLGVESGPLQDADVIDLGDVFPGLAFTVADVFSGLRARPD